MKSLVAVLLLYTTSSVLFGQANPSNMPKVTTVDPRFQSYNIEMVEVIGGRFWRPYGSKPTTPPRPNGSAGALPPDLFQQLPPIDLTNARLRKLAAALSPAYVRVSGTWANTAFFQDSDAPAPAKPPEGFNGVLTRAEWKGVIDFSRAVNAHLVTSFATSMGTRDATGLWTPVKAKKLVGYTQSIGGSIAAAEFMNEPTFANIAGAPKGYDAAAYGRDFAVFQRFFRSALPHSILLGPGSVGEGIDLAGPMKLIPSKEMLQAMGPNAVDAFSYHFYGTVSERCGGKMGQEVKDDPGAALSDEWLSRTSTVEAFYAKLRDEYAPGKPMWLTETGEAACGGDRFAATYLDTFRYLDQLGQLALRSVQTVMHNTLSASDYGLLDEKTLTPRPDYWAALLWHKTMGNTVLNAGNAPATSVHIYAHCMADHPGGVSLLALNLSRTEAQTLHVAQDSVRYTLTAPDLLGKSVQLNGRELTLSSSGDVPQLQGVKAVKGNLSLPPASITVLTSANAQNQACSATAHA